MNQQLTTKDLFFCYDKYLASFLKYDKGIDYLLTAKNPKNDRIFTAFIITDKLNAAIKEWKLVKR